MIVATGGYPVRLARERGLLVRSNPWSEGDGIALALERGATEAPSGEFYGRAMPGPVPEQDFVRASQLYGRFARRVNDRGEEFFPGEVSWSENDLAQAIAAQPGGRAWYELDAGGARDGPRSPRSSRTRRRRSRSPAAACACASTPRSRTRTAASRSTRVPAPPTACGSPAWMRAASRTAATRAALRRRSCSALVAAEDAAQASS